MCILFALFLTLYCLFPYYLHYYSLYTVSLHIIFIITHFILFVSILFALLLTLYCLYSLYILLKIFMCMEISMMRNLTLVYSLEATASSGEGTLHSVVQSGMCAVR